VKIAIITDQHFGARKSSRVFHDFFLKFYNNVFFPTLEKEGITTVIDLGDTFDNRRNVDLWSIEWARKNYYDRLEEMGVAVHAVVGNHTAYFKDTNEINTLDNVLGQYGNVTVYSEPTETQIGGRKLLFIPWINQENAEKTFQLIEETNCECAMGHLELNGFEAHRGHIMDKGLGCELFQKFKQVMSGHYHHRSSRGNIHYLGNPYQLYWNDYRDTRGFHIWDSESLELTFVPNPYEMYEKVFYNEKKIPKKLEQYQGKIIKVIVEDKTDAAKFDYFVSQLYIAGVHEVKIIEDSIFDSDLDSDIDIEKEDTLTILEKYVDEMTYHDKNGLKDIMKSLYVEALELV